MTKRGVTPNQICYSRAVVTAVGCCARLDRLLGIMRGATPWRRWVIALPTHPCVSAHRQSSALKKRREKGKRPLRRVLMWDLARLQETLAVVVLGGPHDWLHGSWPLRSSGQVCTPRSAVPLGPILLWVEFLELDLGGTIVTPLGGHAVSSRHHFCNDGQHTTRRQATSKVVSTLCYGT